MRGRRGVQAAGLDRRLGHAQLLRHELAYVLGQCRSEAAVEVLAADGSGWSALAPMGTARQGPAVAVLPCGLVLVAGGVNVDDQALKKAELWDPATGAWSDLPPMAEDPEDAACCVLPSGRVAVVGGMDANGLTHVDGEVFDPVQGCLGNAQRGLRFCNPRSRPLDLLRPAARFESGERCGALAGTRFGKRDLVLIILRFKRG